MSFLFSADSKYGIRNSIRHEHETRYYRRKTGYFRRQNGFSHGTGKCVF